MQSIKEPSRLMVLLKKVFSVDYININFEVSIETMKCTRDIKKKSSQKLNIYNFLLSFQTPAIIPLVITIGVRIGNQRVKTSRPV